jgi:hypothetical protein
MHGLQELAMKLISHILAATILASGLAVVIPGCSSTQVPADASLVAKSRGDTTYVAGHSGMIYIYDKTWNKMVYSGRVEAGQRIDVDARRNQVRVDGVARAERIDLGEGNQYEFFLRPEQKVVRRTVIEEVPSTTVERRTVVEPAPVIERRTVIEREIP